ncbi:tyrosine-type recombinase/integrase [Crocinitomix catalasitica]|uniref:tyrosine-type recombinase/integrase n=1 Tax=Crocinitomix catalasitica TaxID=184607 RepID=UPI0004816575|nr:tyrosine-type recombinase/integrase [Crocinitomix catalasitica]
MLYISNFIDHLTHELRFSDHTVTAYKNDLEQFCQYLDLEKDSDLLEVNHRLMRTYLVELVESGLENSSVNRKLSSVKSFFKYLRQVGVVSTNPAIKIQALKQKKVLPQFVPEKQLWTSEIFEEESDEFNQVMIELILEVFYQTGIRLAELINLSEKNIAATQIKVLGKRNKERIIPISKDLFNLISKYRNLKTIESIKSDLLFNTKKGKKLTAKFVYSKVNYYLGKATNLSKKSPHVLRHTFATHMLNNGASLESIKKLLGHTDLTSTQIYTHNSFKQIKTIYKQAHPRGASQD